MQGPFIDRRTTFQRLRQLIAPILIAVFALGKWILPLLKFAVPMLKTGGTMIVSVFAYGLLYGWAFGIGIVLLIFVHEAGHLVAARMMGLNVGLPVFIPFMGAVIALKEAPRNAWIEAVVGVGGPILGTIGALAVAVLYLPTGNPLYLALGYVGLMLNLFNLIPIVPLDGGRIVSAISPWLWLVGLAIIVPYLLWRASAVAILILLIVLLSLPRVVTLFRRRSVEDVRYYECTPAQRWTMAMLYFLLLGGAGWTMNYLHRLLNGHV